MFVSGISPLCHFYSVFKTLHDIKAFFGILSALTPPHQSFNPPPNLSSGTFDIQIHLTRLEVSFCPDQLQPDYFETVVKKSKTDPFWETPKLTIAKSNSPVCAVYYCIKRLLPDKYTSSCSVSVPVLRYIAGTLPALILLIIFTGLANH